jgi:coiled-coil domain-containing protein 130
MSSLAAARADNFYIDPSKFDPKRGRGSANAIAGSHPLGDRAKRLKTEGILIVRFELPFDCWCLNPECNTHIAQGVRYNAEKKKIGMYFTSPIYEFRMNCHVCKKQVFIIETDPKNSAYKLVSGIRKKAKPSEVLELQEERNASIREVGTVNVEEELILPTLSVNTASTSSVFSNIEKNVLNKRKADSAIAQIQGLAELSARNWKDDYEMNQKLRKTARDDRNVIKNSEKDAKKIGLFAKPLLKEDKYDAAIAEIAFLQKKQSTSEHHRRSTLLSGDMFANSTSTLSNHSKNSSKLVPGKERRMANSHIPGENLLKLAKKINGKSSNAYGPSHPRSSSSAMLSAFPAVGAMKKQ